MKITLSPRWLPDHGSEVLTDGAVERRGRPSASRTPGADLPQLKRWVFSGCVCCTRKSTASVWRSRQKPWKLRGQENGVRVVEL
jgi:hypothetical protein